MTRTRHGVYCARPTLTRVAALGAAMGLGINLVATPAAQAQKAPPEASAVKAPAEDADRMAAARDLLEAAGAAKQFEAVMPMLMAQMQGLFFKMKPGAEKEIKDVFGEMGKRFANRRSEMFDEIAALYAEKLSTKEMREIAAFYRTGAGARFIAITPELTQRSMAIGQRWGQKIGKELEADARQELKKRGVDL